MWKMPKFKCDILGNFQVNFFSRHEACIRVEMIIANWRSQKVLGLTKHACLIPTQIHDEKSMISLEKFNAVQM